MATFLHRPLLARPMASIRLPALQLQRVRHSSTAHRGLATTVEPSSKKMRMIILGAPGAGKGTQGERLLKKWDISTVGVGDLLRREIQLGTALGRRAEEVMKAGALLPDDIVLSLVEPELEALRGKDWLLDGFPRKASQAVLLDELLSKYDDELNIVVSLDVPDEVILERIEERWIHAPSGRVYNSSFNPPKVPGKDDITGEPLSQRPDDTAEIFAKRLSSFHTENNPLLSHYASSSVKLNPATTVPKLVTLSGRTSDEIFPKLESAIEGRFPFLPAKQ
ncbi:adenylate kinase-domain-containing protein [Leucosporidium creatinivorum]|uniref:GTP:AMP phosphotransferase, mitochondrial n=1 Tax=Leucosporidium creatinivorum TaxID=106004 RepID=A0A1Y2F391_9BASI|nr:adenylate kinase-domain-containing protein [Leucosporidium creatinivorum]